MRLVFGLMFVLVFLVSACSSPTPTLGCNLEGYVLKDGECVRAYICGDGYCDADVGETQEICN